MLSAVSLLVCVTLAVQWCVSYWVGIGVRVTTLDASLKSCRIWGGGISHGVAGVWHQRPNCPTPQPDDLWERFEVGSERRSDVRVITRQRPGPIPGRFHGFDYYYSSYPTDPIFMLRVPAWLPVTLAGIAPALWLVANRRAARRLKRRGFAVEHETQTL